VGPVDQSDGIVSVSASRRGPTSEDAPADDWPIVCEREFDDVVSVAHMRCPFESPGEGEFAILLEVTAPSGELLGTGLYAHIVEP
jgi:hypothetical protein